MEECLAPTKINDDDLDLYTNLLWPVRMGVVERGGTDYMTPAQLTLANQIANKIFELEHPQIEDEED